MQVLHQIMLLCRPGFESECAAEMMDIAGQARFPAYINAKNGTGYANLVSADGRETIGLLHSIDFDTLVFVRQWFACTEHISNLPEKNRTDPLMVNAGQMAGHLGSRFCDIELSFADTNAGKAMSRFCKAFRPHMLSALEREGLLSAHAGYRLHLFFIDSTNAWIGASPVNNSARDPMGIPRLRMPESAPSRSTLKLEEAINWFFDTQEQDNFFKPGMRAVDLGAAPGGWSWQLVNRGLLVTAVDNGPMNGALMASGMVEHLRTDAFTYRPQRKIDWLVCDMAERPLHVSRLIARWFGQQLCSAAIFNLKLPMKKRYQAVMECKDLLEHALNDAGVRHRLRIKQLYHDREEVTACITTANNMGA